MREKLTSPINTMMIKTDKDKNIKRNLSYDHFSDANPGSSGAVIKPSCLESRRPLVRTPL